MMNSVGETLRYVFCLKLIIHFKFSNLNNYVRNVKNKVIYNILIKWNFELNGVIIS